MFVVFSFSYPLLKFHAAIFLHCPRNTKYLVKLATLVEGDPKVPFSIATIPTCRGGCYSFPGIAPLYP